jgi:hypothetical protein
MAEDAAEPGNRKGPQQIKEPTGQAVMVGSFYLANLDVEGGEARNPRNSPRQIVTFRAAVRIDRAAPSLRNQEFSGWLTPGAHFAKAVGVNTFPASNLGR